MTENELIDAKRLAQILGISKSALFKLLKASTHDKGGMQ